MTFLTGLLMAMADSVPGVSGGTIAYIMRKYEALFEHINNILKLDFKRESIVFLAKLGIGWIIGFISAIIVISNIFETHIYQISSLFLGFILISIIIVIRQEREILSKKGWIFTIIGFLVVTGLVYLQGISVINISGDAMTIGSYIYIFIVGMVAISAMLLPGVSGSAVLMIFGIYFLIIESIHSFLTLDFSVVPILIVFGLGVLTGAVGAVKTIDRLFQNHRASLVHLILGLLVGSILSIIYGPTSIDTANLAPLSFSTFSIVFFLIGVGLLALLEFGISKE